MILLTSLVYITVFGVTRYWYFVVFLSEIVKRRFTDEIKLMYSIWLSI